MPQRRTARVEPIARDVRPLPPNPSLEFERKGAKALLRQLHDGDPDAAARLLGAHPAALRTRTVTELRLADAQHTIAREYGFTSWPRLVAFFEEMERQLNAPRRNSSGDTIERLESQALRVLRDHQRGDPHVARSISHFIPRFYGRSHAEILATPITEDEARLVVARGRRRPNWEELVERSRLSIAREQADNPWERQTSPYFRAWRAMKDHNVAALEQALTDHPDLLTPSVIDREWGRTIGATAVGIEREANSPEARRVTDLLASRGVDIQGELDRRLLASRGFRGGIDEEIRWYLDRGANPNWMPPNGIPVLEHAIVNYKSGATVDLIAARTTPRKALWIAAGLDDVNSVRRYIAARGRLTPEGRKNRPDTLAMGWPFAVIPSFEASDLEIMWEAFEIAGWNQRWAAMDALLDAGLPVDYAPLGVPLIVLAVGNLMVDFTSYLVERGADLDRRWPSPANGSVREMARWHITNNSDSEDARRVLAICGAGTPEEVLAELDAKRGTPTPDEGAMRAIRLAADDAARRGQATVNTENMLVGLLRFRGGMFANYLAPMGTDMAQLRSRIGDRLLPDEDPLIGETLPADPGAGAAMHASLAAANAKHREQIRVTHLFAGILSQPEEPGARLLADVGTVDARVRELMKGML